jgi:PAS domain S-box-containing protein
MDAQLSDSRPTTTDRQPELAAWMISRRAQIEQLMRDRLGPAAPGAAAAETEVLRRFRSFAASALMRGEMAAPALDGIRANERRVSALLDAWCQAARDVADDALARPLTSALAPLLRRFRTALRTTGASRTARGAPRARRRVVSAAIDRVADAFLAVEADSGRIVDANPAAGALLGVARDALLGLDAMSFVPSGAESVWWTHLDAMTEGGEPRRFGAQLADVTGSAVDVECSVTRFATRDRTLALVLARAL